MVIDHVLDDLFRNLNASLFDCMLVYSIKYFRNEQNNSAFLTLQ